jgi:predicted transcriptional regulator
MKEAELFYWIKKYDTVIFINYENLKYRMKLPCEQLVERLPVIRSMITREMIETFNLTQEQTAKKLGITQSAVSHYLSGSRGTKIVSDKKLKAKVRKIAKGIIEGKKKFPKSICNICGCHR